MRSFLKFKKKSKKSVRFNEVTESFDAPVYDRTGLEVRFGCLSHQVSHYDVITQTGRLTPYGRRQVKLEINIFKAKEMAVHPKRK